jgi:hypothetical protein
MTEDIQETEIDAVNKFVAYCLRNKRTIAEINETIKTIRQKKAEWMHKLIQFMDNEGKGCDCWAIPRTKGKCLYLRRESKPTSKGLTMNTIQTAFTMLNQTFLQESYEMLRAQKLAEEEEMNQELDEPTTKKKSKDAKKKKKIGRYENRTDIQLDEVIFFATTRALRLALGKTTKMVITVSEKPQRRRISEEHQTILKQSKKTKRAKQLREEYKKSKQHPKPDIDIQTAVLEYSIECARLKKKMFEISQQKEKIKERLGPLTFWAEDATEESMAQHEEKQSKQKKGKPKKQNIVTTDQMTPLVQNVKQYLRKVSPNGKSHRVEIGAKDNGKNEAYLIRESYGTKKPSMTIGLIDTLFDSSLKQSIAENGKMDDTERFKQWNTKENTLPILKQLIGHFTTGLEDHIEKYTVRTINYVLHECPDAKKGDGKSHKRKRDNTQETETDDEYDENDERQVKKRKLDETLEQYTTFIEKHSGKKEKVPVHVVQPECIEEE